MTDNTPTNETSYGDGTVHAKIVLDRSGSVAPIAAATTRASTANLARATARWVFPQPGWPRNSTGRPASMNRSMARSSTRRRPNGRLELEIELPDRLAEREPGETQPGGETPVADRVGLFRDAPPEELDV